MFLFLIRELLIWYNFFWNVISVEIILVNDENNFFEKKNLIIVRKKCINKSYFMWLLYVCNICSIYFWGNGIGKFNWYVRCLLFIGMKGM